LGMSVVIFVLLRLAPGDIVDILFSTGGYVNPSERQAIERELGLDRPIWVQYVDWLGQMAGGNLRESYRYRLPAWGVITPAVPGHARARGAVARDRRGPRRADGRDQRGEPGFDARLRAARVQPGGPLHAVVLARHGHHPRAGGMVRMDPARDVRPAGRELSLAPNPVPTARARGRVSLLRAHHAHHAAVPAPGAAA